MSLNTYKIITTNILILLIIITGCKSSNDNIAEVPVAPYGNVAGSLIEDKGTNNISGATVRIGDRAVVTGSNGAFSFQNVPTGYCIIAITKTGYQPYTLTIIVQNNVTITCNVSLVKLTKPARYDVVVVGAGTGGVSAAIQAARMGVKVALLNDTNWIGGQMTAAAVTSMDECYNYRTGIYEEFIARVKEYYNKLGKSTSTAYYGTSNVSFEPSIGQKKLYEMIHDTTGDGSQKVIDVYLQTKVISAQITSNVVTGITTDNDTVINSKIVIDATEFGDVLPLTHARYRVGNSTSDAINGNACIQDINYTAVIRRYFDGMPSKYLLSAQTPTFNPSIFSWYLAPNGYSWFQNGKYTLPINFEFNLGYRGMPDSLNPQNYDASQQNYIKISKTGLNIGPNETPATVDFIENPLIRKQVSCDAKLKTLQLIYYIQNTMNKPNWSVASDEGFDTPFNVQHNTCSNIPPDLKFIEGHFPIIPYVRESRRIVGIGTLKASDIQRDGVRAIKNFSTSLAVGSYPADLHGCTAASDLDCGDVTSDITGTAGLFQVPFEVFIPELVDGLIAAEKNISVSRVVNGATRLQPISMMTGQAAGAIAAVAVKSGMEPRQIRPLDVQQVLLNSGCMLARYYFKDVPPGQPYFAHTQLVTLYEIMTPYGSTEFGTSAPLLKSELHDIMIKLFKEKFLDNFGYIWDSTPATRSDLAYILNDTLGLPTSGTSDVPIYTDVPFDYWGFENIQALTRSGIAFGCNRDPSQFCPEAVVTRGETAAFIANAMFKTGIIP